MKRGQVLASRYFLGYLFALLLDFIASLNINGTLKSILLFISMIIKFPKNMLDLFLANTELGTWALVVCGIFFVKSAYDLFYGDGLEL